MAEFSISLPFLAPFILVLIMLLVQWLFIYKEKVTLNGAVFEAVRAGALNHGSPEAMKDALAQGMMPLFMEADTDAPDVADVATAYAKARAYVAIGSDIIILNPTPAVFNKFKQQRKYKGVGTLYEIPNDNLMYRSSAAVRVYDDVKINIQDANLLQIEVNWCKRLEVPIANWVIGEILTLKNVDPNPLSDNYVNYIPGQEQLKCNALGAAAGNAQNGQTDYYITLKSYALIRMQSPFRM
ncbi:hypothetical protein [Pseudoalteromonas sp. T1lg48]|uniref:hypothetical protein n=1 Tax=Pseudoalteromonas sp. T1lg48 TaxID=2077100 RepID=UPI000CF7039C|nr:hypothetical protein [Pseudoalteromonas sp. T1lg48]